MATPFRLEQDLIQVHQLRDVLRRPAELPRRAEITVASYNVYNLFGESAERPKPEEQLDALGEMILKLNADIISFAEVEDVETLKSLFRSRVNNELEGDDKYDAFICVPANDPRGINVAMATRLSVRGKMSFSDREFGSMEERATRFSRDLLGVKISGDAGRRLELPVFRRASEIENRRRARGREAPYGGRRGDQHPHRADLRRSAVHGSEAAVRR